jgi:hypothetical protein
VLDKPLSSRDDQHLLCELHHTLQKTLTVIDTVLEYLELLVFCQVINV